MPYVQDLFSLLGGCTAYIHRSTQGWTVREYILLCKVSKLHPPSSLGLDGHKLLLSRLEDAQEVPKEPSSPRSSIGSPCTITILTSAERYGGVNPGLAGARKGRTISCHPHSARATEYSLCPAGTGILHGLREKKRSGTPVWNATPDSRLRETGYFTSTLRPFWM